MGNMGKKKWEIKIKNETQSTIWITSKCLLCLTKFHLQCNILLRVKKSTIYDKS